MEHHILFLILVVFVFIFYNGWMAFICATCHLIFDHKVEKHHISDTKLVCESVLTKKIRNYSGHLKLQSHFRKLVTGN